MTENDISFIIPVYNRPQEIKELLESFTQEAAKVNSLLKSAISTKKNDIELNIHSFHKFWFILLITLIIEWFLRKRKGLL